MQPGDASFEALNYSEALINYKQAYKQAQPDEDLKALLKLCDCFIKLGRFQDAIVHVSHHTMDDLALLLRVAECRLGLQVIQIDLKQLHLLPAKLITTNHHLIAHWLFWYIVIFFC